MVRLARKIRNWCGETSIVSGGSGLLRWYINGYSETGDYASGRDRAGADEALELGGEPSVAEENHEL